MILFENCKMHKGMGFAFFPHLVQCCGVIFGEGIPDPSILTWLGG